MPFTRPKKKTRKQWERDLNASEEIKAIEREVERLMPIFGFFETEEQITAFSDVSPNTIFLDHC